MPRAFQTKRKGGLFMTLIVRWVLKYCTLTVTISARKKRQSKPAGMGGVLPSHSSYDHKRNFSATQ
jgi:hypothetical protein